MEALDFCTSPGPDPALAEGFSPRGARVTKVITELGILSRSGPARSSKSLPSIRAWTWRPSSKLPAGRCRSQNIDIFAPPTAQELKLLRTEVDPDKIYLR